MKWNNNTDLSLHVWVVNLCRKREYKELFLFVADSYLHWLLSKWIHWYVFSSWTSGRMFFLSSSDLEQKRIPGSCLVAVELCRWSGSLLCPVSSPFFAFPLFSIDAEGWKHVSGASLAHCVIDLCLEFLSNLLKATPRGLQCIIYISSNTPQERD